MRVARAVFAVGARLPVNDLNEAVRFYTESFGFEVETSDGSTMGVLRSPQGRLLLTVEPAPPPMPPAARMANPPAALLLLPFCDSVAERLRSRGLHAELMPPPPWGGSRADFIDPFGNRISMFSLGG